MSNVPDDWNSYWYTCLRCGRKYHASEGCSCEDYTEEEWREIVENSPEEEPDIDYE